MRKRLRPIRPKPTIATLVTRLVYHTHKRTHTHTSTARRGQRTGMNHFAWTQS